MEKWQRQFIKSNLPELVEITLCNTAFLTRLYSDDVLSNEEFQEINITKNPVQKASKLYEVIMTRKNAYQLLLYACKETKQTGVESILANGEISHKYKRINQTDNEGRTSLHRVLDDGQSLDFIKSLIDNKADYNLKDKSKERVLHFAVRGGNKEVFSFLLSLKLDINEVDKLGETPLHKVRFTKSRDYLGMTTFLLNNGADFFAKNKNENTVAHLLSFSKNISSNDFRIWVDGITNIAQGLIFAIRGSDGMTPLQSAMELRDLDVATLKLILESSKVDIDQPDDDGCTLLHSALDFGRSLETIKNLISLGANTKMKTRNGSGVLHLAVNGGEKVVIKYLISQGLDINEKNDYGNTPLHFVIQTRSTRYVELTKFLLENGADLYSKNNDGDTLAHVMAISKDVSCNDFKIWVTAMIENAHTQLFTLRGDIGRTPLHSAMQRLDLDLETVKLIIESAKLDINQPDAQGNSILHIALGFGKSLDTIKSLVQLSSDWKKKGKDDRSTLHSAVVGSNIEVFLYIKSLGADVNARDKDGETPLHYVRMTRSKDYFEMTKFFLENGANLYAKDNSGRTIDHFMSSEEDISGEEYREWKEGMIQLGHAEFFLKRKQLRRH